MADSAVKSPRFRGIVFDSQPCGSTFDGVRMQHDDERPRPPDEPDEAPDTPTDEPKPTPVQDPPTEPVQAPYVVRS